MGSLELLLILLIVLGLSGAVPLAKVGVSNSVAEAFTAIYVSGIVFTMSVEQLIFIPLKYSFITFGHPVTMIILAGVISALGYLSGYRGMKGVHAGISGTMFNLQGPLILLFGALLMTIYPEKTIIIGLIVSLVGIALIGSSKLKWRSISIGISFILVSLAPILWALAWVLFSTVSGEDPTFFTFLFFLTTFFVLLVIALGRKAFLLVPREAATYAFLGGTVAGVANASYGIFITSYGTALTGIVTIIAVPVTVLLVIAVLQERYTFTEVLGMIVIGVGLGIALIF
ncbi:MAG: DMT family transporter [Nitrososphaerota archaeon]